jgi:hypothetical protein
LSLDIAINKVPDVELADWGISLRNTGYGFINTFHHTSIVKSSFEYIKGSLDAGLVNIVPVQENSVITLVESVFIQSSSSRGGCIFVNRIETRNVSIFIAHNHFVRNHAMQGGVIFFSQHPLFLTIINCTFMSNEAYLYGHTFASMAHELLWTKRISVDGIGSGDTLPSFSVAMVDSFGESILPLFFNVDFVFVEVQIACVSNSSQTCRAAISTEIAKPLLSSETPFTKTEVIGYPGKYTLVISPVLNYDRQQFRLEKNITISECQEPNILHTFAYETLPRCILRKHNAYHT